MPPYNAPRPRRTIVGTLAATVIALAMVVVMPFEGLVLGTYADPVGIPTACYGHTGSDVEAERVWTEGECKDLLRADLADAYATVQRCIVVPMLPHQAAALTSFTFNVGPGKEGVKDGLCVLKNGQPSTLRRLANAGDWAGACAELEKWVSAKGRRLPGLVRRRAAERALCEGRGQP